MPEEKDTEDYFGTVTLFKQHHFAVPLTSQARSSLRFWMDRSKRGQYFLFYDNGKSAVRSDCGAVSRNQHVWHVPSGQKCCTALADPRHMDIDGFLSCTDPCVLHFPVCGLSWLNGKYKTLGFFPDRWLGKVPLSESFHKDARNLASAENAEEALEEVFLREVHLGDAAEASRQLISGTCMRVLGHVVALDSVEVPSKCLPNTSACPSSSDNILDSNLMGIEKGWILSKAMGYL